MTTISPEISFPVGVRVLMPEQARKRREVELSCVEVLTVARFGEVILPIVDFVDPYREVVGERTLRRSYRFTDREGELLSIRSDFTPMLARAVAPLLDASVPQRFFYRGDVIRYEPSRLGINREFFQIGAELVGERSTKADVEMIILAAELVRRCGSRPTIVVRDSSLIILLTAALSADERRTLIAALRSKQRAAIEWFRARLEPQLLQLLERLTDGALTPEQLLEVKATRAIGERLLEVIEEVRRRSGFELVAALDEVDDESSYYTGIAFDLFLEGEKIPVGRGGRYDSLYGRFGADVPAVGFTLSVDLLERIDEVAPEPPKRSSRKKVRR